MDTWLVSVGCADNTVDVQTVVLSSVIAMQDHGLGMGLFSKFVRNIYNFYYLNGYYDTISSVRWTPI